MVNPSSYFLADLPSGAEVSPLIITEACQGLARNRELYLLGRDTEGMLCSIAALAELWLDPKEPLRQRALEEGPAASGFSRETIEAGLDDFFSELTLDNLRRWVLQDLGHPRRLDDLCGGLEEQETRRHSMAVGPPLLAHICAGNLPNPAWMSIISGLVVRSAQFVKCASGSAFFPLLFGHSLRRIDPKLAACLEIAEWKRGAAPLENALFDGADCVTATGADDTLAKLRGRVPPSKRFLGYGSRLSFAYLAREALDGPRPEELAALAARDIVSWDQLGCLSPHVVYVETGGETAPEDFAGMLARELERCESARPRGAVAPAESAAIAIRRSVYEVRAADSLRTKLWRSEESTAWTVVFEADAQFQVSCLNRFVYVKSSSRLEETLRQIEPFRGQISTVGVAAPRPRLLEVARRLGLWGVSRVCPLGRMQKPSLCWRHDGRPVLADLVTWCDLET